MFDVNSSDFFNFYNLMVLLYIVKEIQGVVVVTFDGSLGQPPKLTVQFELLQTVFC